MPRISYIGYIVNSTSTPKHRFFFIGCYYNKKILLRELTDKLHELKRGMERAVVNRVVEDFIDVAAPLRHFTDAVNMPEGKFFI